MGDFLSGVFVALVLAGIGALSATIYISEQATFECSKGVVK